MIFGFRTFVSSPKLLCAHLKLFPAPNPSSVQASAGMPSRTLCLWRFQHFICLLQIFIDYGTLRQIILYNYIINCPLYEDPWNKFLKKTQTCGYLSFAWVTCLMLFYGKYDSTFFFTLAARESRLKFVNLNILIEHRMLWFIFCKLT